MSEAGDAETPLGAYFGWFTAALVAAMILLAIIRVMFNFNASGVGLITPFIAATIASDRFVQRERRAPTEDERKRLTFGNLGIFLSINALVLLGLVTSGGLQVLLAETKVPMNTFMILFMSILAAAMVMNFLLIRWVYGGIAKKRAAKLSD